MSSGTRWDQIKSAERHGTGAQGQASDGTGASGNLPKYDGTGTLTDTSIAAANVALISAVQQESYVYAADTGTANAYAVTLDPAPTIVAGSEVVFTAANANTGASTLTVNGTSYPLKKSGTNALTGGEITAGQIITAQFDGTNFQITNSATTVVNSGTITPVIGSVAGQGKSYFAGTGTIPTGWQTVGFDDSAWNAPIQETGGTPGSPYPATVWIADPSGDNSQAQGAITLYRQAFNLNGVSAGTLQVGADNGLLAVFLNGTQIYTGSTPTGSSNYSGTINIPATLLVVGTNLLAFEIQNSTTAGSSPTSLDYLLSLYGGASGVGVTLETNSVLNGSQTLQNLKAGTGISLSDDGSGNITITGTGSSPTTTKGDLIVRSSSVDSRLGIGSDGNVLTADSTQTLGVKWAPASGGTGSGVTVTPPYLTVGSTKYLAGNMYAVNLLSTSGWSVIASGSGSISAGANGNFKYVNTSSTICWAYSGVLGAFTQVEWVADMKITQANNTGANFLGIWAYDANNSRIDGVTFQSEEPSRYLPSNGSWTGSTAANPTSASYNFVCQGEGCIVMPIVFRSVLNAAAKTVTHYASFDGGETFDQIGTALGPFTATPSWTGLLINCAYGVLTVYSLKTS